MNRVKVLRIEKNWTQDELGEKLNVKRAAISKYESCKIPLTDETLIKLSEIFGVSTDYILGISESRSFDKYNESLLLKSPELSSDEDQMLRLYRNLTEIAKAELRGEIKGILKTQGEQSASPDSNGNDSNKKAI